MNFHEYQAKQLFAEYGIPVPAGRIASSVDEAVKAAKSLGDGPWMVKAQIHTGGRAKSGGVKFCKTTDEVKQAAAAMLGTKMATYQSAGVALPVNLVLVTEAGEIAKELYLSVLVDRGTRSITYIASSEGGVDIEQVAAETPEKFKRSMSTSWKACSHTKGAKLASTLAWRPNKSISYPKSWLAYINCSTTEICL